MLRLLNVSLARGVRVLYKNVSVTAGSGERVGLVGPNGSGKSTLFAAVLGEITTENGDIQAPKEERISHVAQRITETDSIAIDFVLAGHFPLVAAKKALAEAEKQHDDMELAHCIAVLADLNEGAVIAQAKDIMHGLGFTEADSNKKVSEFSGGWRNRLALARALMTPADLMLLDEPTNHLDLDSVIWLESWLKSQDATVIVISHDREFLDRIAQSIWSIEDGTVHRYAGNYSDFELMRAEKLRLQAAAAKAYERTAAHLQSYIDRFRYKATKAKQAQSRIKMLEKLQAVEPVRASSEWRFEFPEPEKVPQYMVSAEELACGYPERTILEHVKFSIGQSARIGVLGVNGAGKSTLIKTICGELEKISGDIRYGQGTKIGYFAQHQLDQLRDDESPLQHLARLAPEVREQELRNFLGSYRFSNDMALSPVGPMSGGEKARLAMALIAWEKPNLLVLDEPTNHLDMGTREALTMALSSYEGAMLLVSHDRHLLRAACDELWLVHDGKLVPYDGDLEEYSAFVLEERRNKLKDKNGDAEERTVSKKEQRQIEAANRARIAAERKPLQKKLDKVDKELAKYSSELKALDEKLADTAFYEGNPDEVASVLKRHGELRAIVDDLEVEWMDLSEAIEAIK